MPRVLQMHRYKESDVLLLLVILNIISFDMGNEFEIAKILLKFLCIKEFKIAKML